MKIAFWKIIPRRFGFSRWRTLARHGLLSLLMASWPSPGWTIERIASINMCLDQLLLDLAPRSKIVGLSPFARDAVRSWAAKDIGDLPILSGTAEEILVLRPDVVLASSFTKRATRDFLRARSIPLEEFEVVRSIAETREQIAHVGQIIGAQTLAAERIAQLDRSFAGLKASAAEKRLRVLPLSRRGWVSGGESLISDLLSAAGLVNVAGEAGLRAGGFLTLEAIVKLKPDALLISHDDTSAEDQGRAMLLHPAIQTLFPPERRMILPESLTVCGGPMLIEAMDRLAAQIRGLQPRRAVRD